MAQPIDWNSSYRNDPAAAWLFERVRTYGLDCVTDPTQKLPVRVELNNGLIKVRPGQDFGPLQWWVSRAVALTQLGPALVPDLIPVYRADNVVVPLLRRPW